MHRPTAAAPDVKLQRSSSERGTAVIYSLAKLIAILYPPVGFQAVLQRMEISFLVNDQTPPSSTMRRGAIGSTLLK